MEGHKQEATGTNCSFYEKLIDFLCKLSQVFELENFVVM
jgi:hypothetical protein